jgi:hypothetical protein
MDDSEISALARGMVPFVRDCVADAVGKATVLPPELAAQVASAVRMLHESPPVAAAKSEDAPVMKWPLPRVSRIERDEQGNLVPIYADQPV